MRKPYSIEFTGSLAVTRFHTAPTLAEIFASMDEVRDRGEPRRRLWILEKGANLTTEEVQELALHGRSFWSSPSRAAIVAPDDLSFGLARIHDAFREKEGQETRVFRREQDAIAWLESGREPPPGPEPGLPRPASKRPPEGA